ncbi:hypothetical protein Tco_0227766 [Tanacetum coccineum]
MASSHNKVIADAGSENRLHMLEKGSYVPWSSRFMWYIVGKKKYGKMLKDSIKNGPYKMKEITDQGNPDGNPLVPPFKRIQEEADLMVMTRKGASTNDDPIESLTSAMMLLEKDGHVNVQSKDVGNVGRNTGRVIGNSRNVGFGQQVNGSNATVQRVPGISANSGNVPSVQYAANKEQMLLAKKDEAGINLTYEQNNLLLADVPDYEELEELNATYIMIARFQSINNDSDAGPSYDSQFANEVNDSQISLINDMFAKHDHEECYMKQTEAIKPTYDDQIDSNIIFDSPDVEGNSENDTQDKNAHDQTKAEFKLFARNVHLEAEKKNKKCKVFKEENGFLKNTRLGYEKSCFLKKSVAQNAKLYNANSLCDNKVNLDNSTNNVLIPLDSWTSGLLEYKLPLSNCYGIDDPNITMEEYIRLEEEKDQKHGKEFNWETAKYGRICLKSGETLSCEPTVSSLNNEIDFRISFDDSDDEDYTVIFDKNSFSYKIIFVNNLKMDSENDNEKVNMPLFPSPEPTVSCIDDLDFVKDFENEFPAIVYNDALASKSDLLTEPILSPQHIDEFDLKDEISLSECDEEEQNILYFNDLFPFNVICLDDSCWELYLS